MAQKLKEQNINVFVRLRPNTEQEKHAKCSSLLDITSPKDMSLKNPFPKKYHFDRIFDETSTQLDIYTTIVRPLIPEVIGGYNCTVFAYGQTGTGKTYTMTGGKGESQGIIPRAFNHIFDILGELNTECSVRVSYIQLYNEELIDMLSTNERPIRMFEDKNQKGSVILHGIEEISVTNKNQVYKLLEMGNDKRKMAPTLMNTNSSRSHTVFTIIVHTRETTIGGEELVKTGKLNLVDLAGSENILRSGSMDLRAREAGNINQSLLTLGRVIKALTEKNAHIPYRESKLTRLLQDSLGGTTKTSLIATISTASINYEETTSTLDYAMRAKSIKNRPEVNQKISRAALVQQYIDEIERLKRDLQAARSGNGIYLDENNYKLLLEKNEKDRNDLIGKMTTIRNLQITLDEKNHMLQTMKDSWKVAANNIKTLKLEHEMELEEFKIKTVSLENKFYENSETFHNKLSYLYQSSQNNKEVTKAFIDSYNGLTNKITYYIDNSIMVTHQCRDEFEKFGKDVLVNNLTALRTCLENMKKLYADIEIYKTDYFKSKSTRTETIEHFDRFQLEIKDNRKRFCEDICKIIDEMLPQLKSSIQSTSMKIKDKTQQILFSLNEIRTISTHNLQMLSNELLEFHSILLDQYEVAFQKVVKQNKQLMSNKNYIAQIRKNIMEMLSYIEENEDIAISQNNEIANILNEVKTSVTTKSKYLNANIISTIEMNENKCEEASEVLHAFINNGINTDNYYVEKIEEQCKATVCEGMKNIETCFDTVDKNALDMRNKCLDQMGKYEEYFDRLIDVSNNTNLNIENAMDILDKCSNEGQELRAVLDELKEGISHNKDILDHIKGNSKVMLDTVNNFCSSKLNYPGRTGDTPQRVPRGFFNSKKENVDPNISSISNNSEKCSPPLQDNSNKQSGKNEFLKKKLWKSTDNFKL